MLDLRTVLEPCSGEGNVAYWISLTTSARQLTRKTIAAGWDGGPGNMPCHSKEEAEMSEVP